MPVKVLSSTSETSLLQSYTITSGFEFSLPVCVPRSSLWPTTVEVPICGACVKDESLRALQLPWERKVLLKGRKGNS